jgi:hypothetical protein
MAKKKKDKKKKSKRKKERAKKLAAKQPDAQEGPIQWHGFGEIGNEQIEVACTKCGSAAVIEKGDNFSAHVDDNLDAHYLCSKCYGDNTRAPREEANAHREPNLCDENQEQPD